MKQFLPAEPSVSSATFPLPLSHTSPAPFSTQRQLVLVRRAGKQMAPRLLGGHSRMHRPALSGAACWPGALVVAGACPAALTSSQRIRVSLPQISCLRSGVDGVFSFTSLLRGLN